MINDPSFGVFSSTTKWRRDNQIQTPTFFVVSLPQAHPVTTLKPRLSLLVKNPPLEASRYILTTPEMMYFVVLVLVTSVLAIRQDVHHIPASYSASSTSLSPIRPVKRQSQGFLYCQAISLSQIKGTT